MASFMLGSCASDVQTVPVSESVKLGPSRAAFSAGAGERQSANYRLRVSVGAPLAAQDLQSENYRLRVGVGTFTTR